MIQLSKKYLIILVTLIPIKNFSQLTDQEIKDLKTGRIKEETSFIYSLPYEENYRYLFIQGANSSFSHKNELSFDFKMKKGSKVCAARGGKVIQFRKDSQKGGLKPEMMSEGNFIIIEHDDGSKAYYWHLDYQGVVVENGEKVNQGQCIGNSGNTGFSAFPHLHFQVVDKNGKEILPRFYTKKGIKYLRPGRFYKRLKLKSV